MTSDYFEKTGGAYFLKQEYEKIIDEQRLILRLADIKADVEVVTRDRYWIRSLPDKPFRIVKLNKYGKEYHVSCKTLESLATAVQRMIGT
jgi:hypothetical protein